jgi:hypothetical protein
MPIGNPKRSITLRIAAEQIDSVRETGVPFTHAVEEGLRWWLARQRLTFEPPSDLTPDEADILGDIKGQQAALRNFLEVAEARASEQYAKLLRRVERRRLEQRRAAQRESRRATQTTRPSLVPDKVNRQRDLTAVSELGNLTE